MSVEDQAWKSLMVFTNRLMESACCNGLCVVHNEQGEAHRRMKFVTTESDSKGSQRIHTRSSQEKLDREEDEIKLQLEMMRGCCC